LNMLQISIHISEDADDRKIVPVTLQVLIENAIKHNIISELNPLQIRIYDEGDYLVIENNLQTKNIVEGSNKTGLDNMKKLYAFLSDQEVLVESKENKFSVKIPLL
jgi:two-component system LytT family sensor kinase